jgi:bifunctional DNase/RNase
MVWDSLKRLFGGKPAASAQPAQAPAAPVLRCTLCGAVPTPYHVTLRDPHQGWGEMHLCERCVQEYWTREPPVSPPRSLRELPPPGMVPVAVLQLLISERQETQLVYLGELGGQRHFPFTIGFFEACALDRGLKKVTVPRPLTHKAWLTTAETLGAKLRRAGINGLRDQTYFGFLQLEKDGGMVEVDVRPSDALVLCAVADVPFYVSEAVLTEVCAAAPDTSYFRPSGGRSGIQEESF